MEIKRTTEISVEKTRRFRIRQPETNETISCSVCGEPMLTAEASAALFKIKNRRVYQLVEANIIHFTETETGAMFVCLQTLDQATCNTDDVSADEIIKLLSDSATENGSGEIEIKQKVL